MKRSQRIWILDAVIFLSAASVGAFLMFVWFTWTPKSAPIHDAIATGPPPEPVPRIEDHTAAVMDMERPECLTWTSLQRDYSVRLLCREMVERYGTGIPVNPWNVTTYTPCSRIDAIEVDGVRVWERKGEGK